MNKNISLILQLLHELACYFGNRGFEGECCEDLSLTEFLALEMAYANNCISIQDIGQALGMTKSGASRIIDRLENKGYVTRARSPQDGRICCVPVTVKGTELLNRMGEKNTADLEEILKDLDAQTVDQIESTLQLLVKAVHESKIYCSPSTD
ncbi:MAG: MarR family transcriptional regulator [Syntrophomonadaceae bacterium]|nr:MarR family transcriptional regulator [Syntrophomonadaceae bacterium]